MRYPEHPLRTLEACIWSRSTTPKFWSWQRPMPWWLMPQPA